MVTVADILGEPSDAGTTFKGSDGNESLKRGEGSMGLAVVVVVVVTTGSVIVVFASGLCKTVTSVDGGKVESGVGGGTRW